MCSAGHVQNWAWTWPRLRSTSEPDAIGDLVDRDASHPTHRSHVMHDTRDPRLAFAGILSARRAAELGRVSDVDYRGAELACVRANRRPAVKDGSGRCVALLATSLFATVMFPPPPLSLSQSTVATAPSTTARQNAVQRGEGFLVDTNGMVTHHTYTSHPRYVFVSPPTHPSAPSDHPPPHSAVNMQRGCLVSSPWEAPMRRSKWADLATPRGPGNGVSGVCHGHEAVACVAPPRVYCPRLGAGVPVEACGWG